MLLVECIHLIQGLLFRLLSNTLVVLGVVNNLALTQRREVLLKILLGLILVIPILVVIVIDFIARFVRDR